MREILDTVLEIIFDTPVDLSLSPKLLIARRKFLIVYLSLLLLLAKLEGWSEIAKTHCIFFCASIKNSYYNYNLCAKVR